MKENEKTRAVIKLMGGLSKGEKSAQEKGWADIADAEKLLGVTNGEMKFSPEAISDLQQPKNLRPLLGQGFFFALRARPFAAAK